MKKLLREHCNPYKILSSYLLPNSNVNFSEKRIPECPIPNPSPAIVANRNFFEHAEWVKNYFEACHRDRPFKERWLAAGGSWDDKIVVDIGCGPGNLYANLGGSPRVLIGVDISPGALNLAQEIGYTPLLADAHQLPFIDGFADLVALNATLHHCEDMAKVLTEASRLVRPGGILIADHDPQLSAWNYKGLALLMYKLRLPIYRLFLQNLHIPKDERLCMLETEIHHKPGDGITAEFFHQILEPLGFTVKIYPHNQTVGAEALQGNYGLPPHWRYRLGQRLSGIDPNSPEAALSLLCVAIRKANRKHPAPVDHRKPLVHLVKEVWGKVFVDSYVSQKLATKLLKDYGIEFFAKPRCNMKNKLMKLHDKLLSRKRTACSSSCAPDHRHTQ